MGKTGLNESAEKAWREIDKLSDEQAEQLEEFLYSFLLYVREQAFNALDAAELIAAADPFAYTNVMNRWRQGVRDLVDLNRLRLGEIERILVESDLPGDLYRDVAETMKETRAEGKSDWHVKRRVTDLLIPRNEHGKRESSPKYKARVTAMARNAATQNYNTRSLYGLIEAGYTEKEWVAHNDERTRSTHVEADGQVVDIHDSFTVGGWPMMYPGDKSGPIEETANCRCIVVGSGVPGLFDDDDDDDELEASAMTVEMNLPMVDVAYWAGIIGCEGKMTGDGRLIENEALTWDLSLPIPLSSQLESIGGHDGSVVVGRILSISRRDNGDIWASGDFDLGSEAGRESYRLVSEGLMPGVSMDLDDVSFEVRVKKEIIDELNQRLAVAEEGDEAYEPDELPEDASGERYIVMSYGADDELMVTTSARIRGATLVDTPAFIDARIAVVESIEEEESDMTNDDVLEASAGPILAPPAEWFDNPNLSAPTPLTITPEGRVYGHLATWDVCHIAAPAGEGVCVTAPHSITNYARFHTGSLVTSDGRTIAVGKITMGTGHAGPNLQPQAAAEHYDNTGTAMCDVRAGEDQIGIWVAGSIRPGVTEAQIRTLRASPLSGDWRRVDGNLELHAALAVNVPGFPIPRPAGLVAAGSLASLVASGMVPPAAVKVRNAEGDTLSADDLAYLRKLAERNRQEEAAKLAASVRLSENKLRVKRMAQALGKE